MKKFLSANEAVAHAAAQAAAMTTPGIEFDLFILTFPDCDSSKRA